MEYQTYDFVSLVPSGNLQGSQNVFVIFTGSILKQRTIKEFHMHDRVARFINDWVKK